jgi:hypothetical protein
MQAKKRGPKRKLPFGVKALIMLQVVNAFLFFGAIIFSHSHRYDFEQDIEDLESNLDSVEMTASNQAIDLLYVALGLAIAYGLFRLEYWAWIAIMVWSGTRMAGSLALYIEGDPSYLLMVRDVLIVFYLNQRDVRRAFARHHNGTSEEAYE